MGKPLKGKEFVEFSQMVSAMYSADGESIVGIARKVGRSCGLIKKALQFFCVPFKDKNSLISSSKMGKQSPRKGAVLSDETRAKISAAKVGKRHSLGSRRTPEQKQKMSDARKRFAEQNPQRFKELMRRASTAVPKLSKEEREKRTKARTRYKHLLSRLARQHGLNKQSASEAALGYSAKQFREHIERQFCDGMDWDKPDSFHIDHIVPIADFFRKGIYDAAVINALSNLRPLSPSSNRQKRDKREFLV